MGLTSTTRSGLISQPLNLLDTRSAVQLGVVYNYLVYMILPIYVSLERSNPALREAARDLGANRWRTFVDVTLPDAASGIAAGSILFSSRSAATTSRQPSWVVPAATWPVNSSPANS